MTWHPGWVQIRPGFDPVPAGGPPGDPAGDQPPAAAWRVPPSVPALKLASAAVLVLLGLFLGPDPVRVWLAVLPAIGLAVWAVRDLVARVRLVADPDGLTVVRGFAGRQRLAWTRVERIRVDTRPHLGLRTETLEVDTGEDLHLFSAYDLGARPAEVAAALESIRPAKR